MVERISPQATIKNNIKGYPARIVLKNVDPRIRPGMTANVKIPVAPPTMSRRRLGGGVHREEP